MRKRNNFTANFLSRFNITTQFATILLLAVCFFGAATHARAETVFTATLNGAQTAPPTNSTATGIGSAILNDAENNVTVTINLNGLANTPFVARIHAGALPGSNAEPIFSFPIGVFSQSFNVNAAQAEQLKAGLWYFNVTTDSFPDGEIRGQIERLCAPPPENIIALYRAERNLRDSLGGNDGSAPLGVGYQTGKVGQAFGFNGTDQHAALGNFFDFPTFTLSMWVKPEAHQLAFANLIDNNRNAAANWGIAQDGAATNIYTYFDAGASVNFSLAPGVWQHLTVVRAANIVIIYRNGSAESSSGAASPIIYDGAQTLYLARSVNRGGTGSNRNWSGQIDELAVFNRALTETEIRNLYFSGSGGVCMQSARMTAQNGKIVFSRKLETNVMNLFSINSDGSDLTNLSNSSAGALHPSISPDGTRILFDRNGRLFTMNFDGSNQQAVPGIPPLLHGVSDWSPDGNRISFTNGVNSTAEIFTANLNGTNQRRLTNNTNSDTFAEFSPDGFKIVFQAVVPQSTINRIYVMNTDGTELKFLTDNHIDTEPSWSPDGAKIIFNRGGEIYRMNADGTEIARLTRTSGFNEYGADWSPDGTKIVYTRLGNNVQEIWTMNADGSNQTCLVCGGLDVHPRWQPILNNQNVTAFPASNVKVSFSFVESRGRVVATELNAKLLPELPSEYVPFTPIFDIRTSATYLGSIDVSFALKSVPSAFTCSQLRVLRFTDGEWNSDGNAAAVYDSGNCTVSQTVSALSPFTVARINTAATSKSISGTIIYGTTPAGQAFKPVSNVSLTATGDSLASFVTTSDGDYLFDRLIPQGAYAVTTAKTGDVNGISSFDATLILRHVAAGGSGILNPNQRLAADADNDRAVTAFDATQILRFVAAGGKSNVTGKVGDWKFSPATRNYPSLIQSLTEENYEAILIGEVSGDWLPSQINSSENSLRATTADATSLATNKHQNSVNVQLELPTKAYRIENGVLIVPVLLSNNNEAVSGFALDVEYDPDLLKADSNRLFETAGTLTEDNFLVVADASTPGRIGIAASGGNELVTTSGTLINLRFKATERAKATPNRTNLNLSRVVLDNNK